MKIQKHSDIHIEFRSLTKVSESGEVLFENVNGAIFKHAMTTLEGPSGCGKTTLLRIIAGLDAPTSGAIVINGDVATEGTHIYIQPFDRNIGMLFQDLALWPHMSCIEQLKFVWDARHTQKATFEQELHTYAHIVDFPENLLERYPHQLSRGQQQRLAIMRCIITQPPLLFFDEPFTGLDKHLRNAFITCLQYVRKTASSTILLVTHDLYHLPLSPDHAITYEGKSLQFH